MFPDAYFSDSYYTGDYFPPGISVAAVTVAPGGGGYIIKDVKSRNIRVDDGEFIDLIMIIIETGCLE